MSAPDTASARLEREISAVARDRLGRECVYVPSGRLALYLALRIWLPRGGRLLMAPVNDDVILFVVLAAGLRPVFAPASPADGNIDPGAVPQAAWSSVDGVLTTNLYGLPDRVVELRARCDALGIPLIEDAAHAIQTVAPTATGPRLLGTFGEAAAFSLSKHAQAMGGGFLTVADPDRREEVERRRDELLAPRALRRDVVNALKPLARSAILNLGLTRPVWRAMHLLGMVEREGAYRMDLDPPALTDALQAAPDLLAFDRWIRVDLRDYRRHQGSPMLRGVLTRLRALEQQRPRRLAGVRRLAELETAAPAVREGPPQPLFRVPLLVENRDAVIAALERHGIVTGYVYDPPLDDYAGTFADPAPEPDAEHARWFARHALPVNPLDADRVLRALTAVGIRPPATPAPARHDDGARAKDAS